MEHPFYTVLGEDVQRRVDAVNDQLRASNDRLAQLEADNLRLQTKNTNLTSVGQRFARREDPITTIQPMRPLGSETICPMTEGRSTIFNTKNIADQYRESSDFERDQAYIESIIEKRLCAFELVIEKMSGVAPP
ncbi:unnamed protein product [Cochlearia groenlandica]